MNRNVLIIVIVILALALAVLGWKYYEDQNTASLEINFGENGISVDAS